MKRKIFAIVLVLLMVTGIFAFTTPLNNLLHTPEITSAGPGGGGAVPPPIPGRLPGR